MRTGWRWMAIPALACGWSVMAPRGAAAQGLKGWTLMQDGAPHVSPVWISVEGERLAIFSTQAHLKIRNLRRDPRIAISVADEHNPYRSVVIRGAFAEVAQQGVGVEVRRVEVVGNRDELVVLGVARHQRDEVARWVAVMACAAGQ